MVRHLPNLLSLLRILASPWILRLAWEERNEWALGASLVAGLTDFLDGFLARRLRAESRLGAWLDPVGDKLLLAGMFLVFGWKGVLPWWLTVLVFGRDALILLFAAGAILFTQIREFPPSIWGKLSTAIQILTVLVVLIVQADGTTLRPLVGVGIVCTALAAGWSGVHYAWIALGMLRRSSGLH